VAVKNVDVEIDFLQLDADLKRREEQSLLNPDEPRVGVRTTVFSLGKNRVIGSEPNLTSPDLQLIEILKDGLQNIFTRINWRIARSDVDRGGIVGFNIYRRKLNRKAFLREFRRDGEPLLQFSPIGVSRLARNIPKRGDFAPEQKAISHISREIVSAVDINPLLAEDSSVAQARYESSLNLPTASRFSSVFDSIQPVLNNNSFFHKFFNERRFKKIGYVSYDSFLAKEQMKFITVTEREFVDLSFDDKSTALGDVYEYYVKAVPKDIREGVQSNVVKVFIEDVKPVRPPEQLRIKLIDSNTVRVSICADKRDDILRVLVFRKAEDEVFFERVATFNNISDCINFLDTSVDYGRKYTYRVFMENIHGVVSTPGFRPDGISDSEISISVFFRKILPRSRSNNLKNPILNAIQDQNSDLIKINIAANDPLVSYYELERRDLTINERSFAVPGRTTTGFGGDGWTTNQFFVQNVRTPVAGRGAARGAAIFNRRSVQAEIEFIDDTVERDHIYQYRVRGRDMFGNPTSYAFATVRAVGRAPVRTPINLRLEVLRGHPYRAKLMWNSDNQAVTFTPEELFKVESRTDPDDVKYLYRVQRRKLGQTRYEEFPLTANEFFIDEVSSRDTLPLFQKKIEDTFTQVPNISTESLTTTFAGRGGAISSTVTTAVSRAGDVPTVVGPTRGENIPVVVRPFQTPQYLEPNETYFYRISARNVLTEESNFTKEFRIRTTSQLADPENFKVEVLNLRVAPLVGKLTWTTSDTETRPDHWILERKFDVQTDTFQCIGRAYLREIFLDKDLELGSSYIYRIKSIDTLGRESEFFEARLTL